MYTCRVVKCAREKNKAEKRNGVREGLTEKVTFSQDLMEERERGLLTSSERVFWTEQRGCIKALRMECAWHVIITTLSE